MSDLKVGDVVLVHESGWGFREEDVGKYVEIETVSAGKRPFYFTVREYDQALASKQGIKWEESFGENPMVLLNTIEERERMEKEIENKISVGEWVIVDTDHYEYMGLYKNSVVQVTGVLNREHISFHKNGKDWVLRANEVTRLGEGAPKQSTHKEPIKSDGGSSSYYDIQLPQWLLDKLNERAQNGQCFIKTEELIEVAFSNDFDASNICKSLVRAWGAFNGGGKLGNDVAYECKKIQYSANKLIERSERKESK